MYPVALVAWMCILIVCLLLGFSSLITETRKRKLKHVWARKVMDQLLDHFRGDREFGRMDTAGMDPHVQPSECIKDIANKTPTLEEAIASEFEKGSTQESQQIPGAELNYKNAPKMVIF